jgi:feruloyl esterase
VPHPFAFFLAKGWDTRNQECARSRRQILGLSCIAIGLIALTPALLPAQQPCEDLKKLSLDHVTITAAVSVEPAPLQQPAGSPFKAPDVNVPLHCEVAGVARPTSDSEIDFLLWLPPAGAWNGKFMQRGNGGWAGSIYQGELVRPLTLGYAVSATDDGHHSDQGLPSAGWAVGHPEKLIDFGYRAVHETADASKAILRAYYGKPDTHDYFVGCSDGGREALMEAERYPEDFDGILAGAPANHWTHLLTGALWNEQALKSRPESEIPAASLPAIQKAALAQCDALDGVKDGVIEDPRACHFDPSVLLCHGAASSDCLTQPQIDALEKVYSGPKDPVTGARIFPGFEPGAEAESSGWSLWIVGPLQSAFANSFFGQALHEDPKWDWRTADLSREVHQADEKSATILNSWYPDLRTFRAHGGKLIQYHGWEDAAISPRDSIDFYEQVRAFLATYPDPRSSSSSGAGASIDSFYRLYMVPGMQHCGGGQGATNFGTGDTPAASGLPDDAGHDMLAALDRWVTHGVAPEQIIASGTIGADAKAGVAGTHLTRPLCVYPAVAHYKGQGDTNAAENFACVVPAK